MFVQTELWTQEFRSPGFICLIFLDTVESHMKSTDKQACKMVAHYSKYATRKVQEWLDVTDIEKFPLFFDSLSSTATVSKLPQSISQTGKCAWHFF